MCVGSRLYGVRVYLTAYLNIQFPNMVGLIWRHPDSTDLVKRIGESRSLASPEAP